MERAPAFLDEENQALLDALLPNYRKLFGKPREQVTAYEKEEIWRDIARTVRSAGGPRRRMRNIKKRWQDLRCWTRRIARVQLHLEAPRRHGGSRQLTPHMLRVLEVVFPDLHRQLQEGQQQGGASSPTSEGDTSTDQTEGPSHSATSHEESEGESGTEGEGSQAAGHHEQETSYNADGSGSDSQEEGEFAAMALPPTLPVPSSSSNISTLPVGSVPRVRATPRVSFVPGTAAPAPVSPAALAAESVDLLRQLLVGQTSMLTVLHRHTQVLTDLVSYMEGMSSSMSDLRRSVASIDSAVTAALPILQSQPPPPSDPSTSPSPIPVHRTRKRKHSHTPTDTPTTPTRKLRRTDPSTHSQGEVGTPTGRRDTHHSHSHRTPDSQPSTSTPIVSPGSGDSLSELAAVCSKVYLASFGTAPDTAAILSPPAPTSPALPSPIPAVPDSESEDAPHVSTDQ